MASISAAGIGSGLDINSIVSQLMELERRPLQLLENQKLQLETQLSGYGKLRSALDRFQSAMDALGGLEKFKVYTAVSGDEEAFTASASSEAASGSLSIEVQNLAVAHRMGSTAFADADTTTVGNAGDEMTLTVDGESFTVEIGGKTLNEIRDAVNEALDNVGVTATVLKQDDANYRLILSADETGTAKAVQLSFANGGAAIADPLGMSTTVAAEDARILVDGLYTITRGSNIIDDAVQGVTLNLKAETAGPVSLTVARDVEAVTASVEAFVQAYNTLRETITDLRAGELEADNTLLTIERRVLSVLNNPPESGTFRYLTEIGVSIQKDGAMSVDKEKLESALQRDFAAVAELFAGEGTGYAHRLEAVADELLSVDGLVEAREDGIDTRIDRLDQRAEALERRLELTEARYLAQFTALDALVSQLNVTSNYLTQQLAMLQNK